MTKLADPSDEPRRLWTRGEYELMAASGVFLPEERVELIDGDIITRMPPQLTPHIVALLLATRSLTSTFGPDWIVGSQIPIALGPDSEPEPDLIVVPGPARRYLDHKATAKEIHLLIEVSDSSLTFDRGRKAMLYARHGIAEYWILNLVERTLEVRRDPDPEIGYRAIRIARPEDSVEPLSAPGAFILVSDLLP